MTEIDSLKFLITIAYIFLFFSVFLVIVNHKFINRFNDRFIDEEKRLEQKMTVIEREVCSLKMPMTTAKSALHEQIRIAESRLILYYKAEKAILSGQSYEAEGLKLTRANLKDVQNMITALESKISALKMQQRGRTKFRVVRPSW